MPYAIIRVAKIKTAQQAHAKTAHNYREHTLSNVDQEAPHPNREYLNHERRDFGELAAQRIEQVVSRKVRADQVRAVEVIMTGSPEVFKRDAQGRAVDYSKSKWAQDNLHFLQKKYGPENVVSFTLHQDEKTPHIHAVVVPITSDYRLAAKELFNPQGLRQLQTEYAQAMQAHGMSRGVEHSQTKHQAQRRLYGQADQAAQLVPVPATVQAVELAPVPLLGREEWRSEQQAHVNAELHRQVGQAQERAQRAAQQAQASASAQEQVKTLRKQLATSEGLKQAHFAQVAELTQARTRLAVQIAQFDKPALEALLKEGQQAREQQKTALVGHLEQILKGKVPNNEHFVATLKAQGYAAQRTGQDIELVHQATGAKFLAIELRPNGQAIGPQLTTAIERTAKQKLAQNKGYKRDGGISG